MDRFLAATGMSRDDLEGEVRGAAGNQCAAYVAGSITEGFSNAYSDLDVHVVRGSAATSLPLMIHVGSCRIDLALHAQQVTESALREALESPVAAAGRMTRPVWERTRKSASTLSRLACSVPLYGQESQWDVRPMCVDLVLPALAQWWRAEASRRLLAAQLLRERRPRVSARRYHEAHAAALDALVTGAGEGYFGFKWLPEKLRRIGWKDDLEDFRRCLRGALSGHPEPRWCEERIRYLLDSREQRCDYSAVFSLAPGVCVHRFGEKCFIARWDMRSVEVGIETARLVEAGVERGDGIVYRQHGCAESAIPEGVADLFVQDFLWLGVGVRDGAGI